jgi:hypothetical protein
MYGSKCVHSGNVVGESTKIWEVKCGSMPENETLRIM